MAASESELFDSKVRWVNNKREFGEREKAINAQLFILKIKKKKNWSTYKISCCKDGMSFTRYTLPGNSIYIVTP